MENKKEGKRKAGEKREKEKQRRNNRVGGNKGIEKIEVKKGRIRKKGTD